MSATYPACTPYDGELDNPTYALRQDAGKVDYTYLEKPFRDGVCNVMEYGTRKYSRDNWKCSIDTPKHDKYRESILRCLLRHAHALADGELIDAESGLPHAAHVATNCMFLMQYDQKRDV